MSFSKEERTSLSSEQNESDDSQNINGSLKENQLEDELEYNKNEIIDTFNEVNQIQKKVKKVSFNDKNLVTIIEVESYKKYNCTIERGGNQIKNKNKTKDKLKPQKRRKDVEDKKEMKFDEKYYDKDGDSDKSCLIF